MDLNITGKDRSQKGFWKANFLFRIPQFNFSFGRLGDSGGLIRILSGVFIAGKNLSAQTKGKNNNRRQGDRRFI